MRDVGALTKKCLDYLSGYSSIGRTTAEIDYFVENYAREHELKCATKGYKGFPSHCCTSLNEEACHGIPTSRKLKDGDLLKVDVTFVNKAGYHGDSCRTFAIGKIKKFHQNLLDVAHEAMWRGINACQPGNKIIQVGEAIKPFVEKYHMHVAKDWCGHGIGLEFHTRPMVPHYPDPYLPDSKMIMVPGMCITIEPIITLGKSETKLLKDGWTVRMKDRKFTAQFEHTIGITDYANEAFTA